MQPATQYAGYPKPEGGGGTMSGPTTPSELSPGGTYRTHSMSDYDAPTGWHSPPPPVQAFEMDGSTPAPAADPVAPQMPKQPQQQQPLEPSHPPHVS
ncbi:hypothetical protein PG996_007253 [Apiospora saccharicola]|uniref:Uncharacterized protein n=1 Tax=Apiospora saccharicola TaxID=335842 RepID=A0ABR1VAD3_9PEZI